MDSLYFHFWPNAYSTKTSAFAQQQIRNGSLDFRFASEEEMGKMWGLDMEVNGTKTELLYKTASKEIGGIALPAPLSSGATAQITTPFKVKIPKVFSRLGHDEQHYCITQWFPKVAKYDNKGWHFFPYLDLGEFYDDFGSYDVFITVPSNYVVAATGNLMTDSETEWLNERAEESRKAIYKKEYSFMDGTSNETKTLHFHEENIHDFAWFANPRFLVAIKEVEIDSTHTVGTYAFFTEKNVSGWNRAVDYVGQSVMFYSESVGPYPYKTVKAVEGPLVAGGGMEYPTITVITQAGASLKRVILHEVGHNWFQGMFGTNERRFPYLDEGFNSYYENRYYRDRPEEPGQGGLEDAFTRVGLQHIIRRKEDQSIDLHSDDYSSLNYGLIVYAKAAEALEFLEHYLGREVLDSCMQTFFDEWRLRHPGPEDFKEVFERISQKDLDWFFEGFMGRENHYDYGFKKGNKTQVTVSNKGDIVAPFKLTFRADNGALLGEQWIEGLKGDTTFPVASEVEKVLINEDVGNIEAYDQNNYFFPKKIFKGYEKQRINVLNPLESAGNKSVAFFPVAGYNTADGGILGLAVYKPIFPQQKFQYQLVPMLGLNSGNLTWLGNVQRNWYWRNEKHLKQLNLGISSRRFSIEKWDATDGFFLDPYNKFQLYFNFHFKNKNKHQLLQQVHGRMVQTDFQRANESTWPVFGELGYRLISNKPTLPFTFNTTLRGGEGFVSGTAEISGSLPYNRKKDINFRFFAGQQSTLNNGTPNGLYFFRANNRAGLFDYMADELVFDRSGRSDFFVRQLVYSEGGITTPYSHGSDSYMFAANISAELPKTPFRAMFNGVASPNRTGDATQISYEAGLQLQVIKKVLYINVPFIYSADLRDFNELNTRSFADNITFTLSFSPLNPFGYKEAPVLKGIL